MADVKAIPDEYRTITPYLCVDDAAAAIEFYTRVFGAKERMRMPAPDGRIGHAELTVGDSVLMLSDEYPEMEIRGPKSLGGTAVTLSIYVEDVDDVVERATNAGAKVRREVQDQFYGDRSGQIEDPFGHLWSIQTHVEDVAPDEMQRRAAAAMQQG
jgi:PhnB protein